MLSLITHSCITSLCEITHHHILLASLPHVKFICANRHAFQDQRFLNFRDDVTPRRKLVNITYPIERPWGRRRTSSPTPVPSSHRPYASSCQAASRSVDFFPTNSTYQFFHQYHQIRAAGSDEEYMFRQCCGVSMAAPMHPIDILYHRAHSVTGAHRRKINITAGISILLREWY